MRYAQFTSIFYKCLFDTVRSGVADNMASTSTRSLFLPDAPRLFRRCRPGHPIMRTLVTRIRGSCGPRPPAGMGTNCGRGPFPSDLGNSTSCLTTALMDKSMPPTRNEDIENTSSATRASCTTGRGAVVDRAEVEMGTSIGDPLAAVVKAFGDNRGRDNSVTTREDEENDVLRGLLAGLLADEDRECLAQAVKGVYRLFIVRAVLKRAFCKTSKMRISAELAFCK